MAGSQVSTSVTIINSLLGFQAISLTEFDTSAESSIAAGSKVEIASAFFTFATDESISGFSSITTGETCYIALTPAGTAGSQTVSAAWVSAAPVWDDAKQGWYTTTSSSIRVVGGVYKSGATSSEDKFLFTGEQYPIIGQSRIAVKTIQIGDWNMTSANKAVAHGISDPSRIRFVTAMVRGDTGSGLDEAWRPLDYAGESGYVSISSTNSANVFLAYEVGGTFDSPSYNATSYNRGFITIWYEP